MPLRSEMTGLRQRGPVFSSGRIYAVPVLRRYALPGILSALLCLIGGSAMAAERSFVAGGPPLNYRLDELSVRFLRQPGHGLPGWRVSLAGSGAALLESDGQKRHFFYPVKDLLALVNELYRIRFFELPITYTTKYSVFIKDDGLLGTQGLRMSDASSTRVCFAVAAYEKCVSYGADGPRELEALVQHVVADTERLVSPGLSKP